MSSLHFELRHKAKPFKMIDFLKDGPDDAQVTLLLVHGAGAPMDSPAMTLLANAFADAKFAVVRFEFTYMAARRSGSRRPPPRADKLIPEYRQAVEALSTNSPLVIGGKSMGGRVASMAADALYAEGAIKGVLCLGYPFHPPAKPENLRTVHLETMRTPTLICQGTRDPFGTKDEVSRYMLSPAVELCWFEDGDHDLKPRKNLTGFTAKDYAAQAAQKVADWARRL